MLTSYILRRLISMIPVIIGITLITFILINVVPGDPVINMMEKRADEKTIANIRHQLGLDRPLYIQYLDFLNKAIRGNLGKSFYNNQDVMKTILQRFPTTVKLSLTSMLLAVVIGITIGIISSVKQYSFFDHFTMVLALIGISAPVFWVAIILQLIFGLRLKWFPISGFYGAKFMVLPAITLGTRYAASIARMTRSSMLEVVRQDYIRTARAKGLAEKVVIYRHALKNALIPVVTLIGLQVGGLLAGSILTETVFGIPGLGRLSIEGINNRDFPVIQGTVLFTALVFVFTNLFVDISYSFLDPRIRYDRSEG